jgi:hypothetical protein
MVLTALTYMSVSAVEIGVPKNVSFYILAIANAASTFGRVSAGLLADRVGTPRHYGLMGHKLNFNRCTQHHGSFHNCSGNYDICLAIC